MALRADVAVAVLEEEAVLLDLETKYFYSVNGSGWAIVQLFESGATVPEARRQCSLWGAPQEDGAAIDRLLDVLIHDGLVVQANQAVAPPSMAFSGPWTVPTIEKHKEPLQRIMVSAFDPTLPLAE